MRVLAFFLLLPAFSMAGPPQLLSELPDFNLEVEDIHSAILIDHPGEDYRAMLQGPPSFGPMAYSEFAHYYSMVIRVGVKIDGRALALHVRNDSRDELLIKSGIFGFPLNPVVARYYQDAEGTPRLYQVRIVGDLVALESRAQALLAQQHAQEAGAALTGAQRPSPVSAAAFPGEKPFLGPAVRGL